jgi:hypothetical protein
MNPPDDSREITMLESKGILIKDQNYQVVLTNRRIILTSYSDKKSRSINVTDVQKIELGTNDSGDPVIIVFVPSVTGEIKKVNLHFSPKNFPDPHQVSSLWSSEINTLMQPAVPVSQGISTKFSPDTTTKKGSSPQAFCVTCGTKFVDGSVFCNKCGTKIIYPVQPLPPEQIHERIHEEVIAPEISPGKIEMPRKKIPLLPADDSYTREKVPVTAPLYKEQGKKKSFFTGSGKRKPAVIFVSVLAGIIVIIAALFLLLPSVSPGFNLTSSGTDSPVPEVTITASAASHGVTTTTIPQTPRRLTITPTISKTTSTSATPVQTSTPDVVVVQPSVTPAPGDPATVLVSYPSLFNAADGAGITALLTEDIKSEYPLDFLNNELDAARSSGYSIEKIDVTNQILEGSHATLIVDVSWNTGGSSQTSTQILLMAYENGQWKLNTLILYL